MKATAFDGCWDIRDHSEGYAYIHGGPDACSKLKIGTRGEAPETALPYNWGICIIR